MGRVVERKAGDLLLERLWVKDGILFVDDLDSNRSVCSYVAPLFDDGERAPVAQYAVTLSVILRKTVGSQKRQVNRYKEEGRLPANGLANLVGLANTFRQETHCVASARSQALPLFSSQLVLAFLSSVSGVLC